jgi:signal transduction histidine kinase
MNTTAVARPIPSNEIGRVISLSEFDLDYSGLKDNFKDLTKLAAKVAGTRISFLNLIDSLTQWTVSDHGLSVDQMPREESLCQYTIMQDDFFEVQDLSSDERFRNKDYVKKEPRLKYYLGVPLKTNGGHNIGALCVLDNEVRTIDPEKIELLKIVANEVINRLNTIKIIEDLKRTAVEATDTKLKVAHDIRGPLSGIVSLAKLISEQGDYNKLEDVLQFVSMIQKSGNSILELADEILTEEKKAFGNPKALQSNEFNLLMFKDKLEKLYHPQAFNKEITFTVNICPGSAETPFYKNKLLQITGNLVSNAIKFTPEKGFVTVDLNLIVQNGKNTLHIVVKDSGVGLTNESISEVLTGCETTSNGTRGEQGYGFGLVLVKHLIDTLKGTMHIHSNPLEGATFEVLLPQG